MTDQNTRQFIGVSLSGLARSGKDTFAEYLIKEYGYAGDYFARPLKTLAFNYLGWDGEKDEKGRRFLQLLGTDVGRAWDENIWLRRFAANTGLDPALLGPATHAVGADNAEQLIKRAAYYLDHNSDAAKTSARLIAMLEFGWDGLHDAKSEALVEGLVKLGEYDGHRAITRVMSLLDFARMARASQSAKSATELCRCTPNSQATQSYPLVVPDTRFPNEADFLRANGMITIKIERPGLQKLNHVSERALDNYTFDVIIQNDGSLADFHQKIEQVIQTKLLKR